MNREYGNYKTLVDNLLNPENIIIMKFKHFALLALVGISMMSCQTTEPSGARFLTSYDGFKKAGGLSNAQVYYGDLEKLASYRRVYIEPVRIIPASTGEAKNNKPTAAEISSLKGNFESELRTELATTHTVVSRPGRRTLTLRAALIELEPGNPALFMAGYAPYAGAVTAAIGVATGKLPGAGATSMQAEVIDSRTREQFYAVIDRDQTGRWQPAEGMTRWGLARACFRKWSGQIRKQISKGDSPVEVAASEKADATSAKGSAKS